MAKTPLRSVPDLNLELLTSPDLARERHSLFGLKSVQGVPTSKNIKLKLFAGNPSLPEMLKLEQCLVDLDAAVAEACLRIVKVTPSTIEENHNDFQLSQVPWKRLILELGADDEFVLKLKRWQRLPSRLWHSIALAQSQKAAFRKYLQFAENSILVPQLFAAGALYDRGLVVFSFLLMKKINGMVPIDRYISDLLEAEDFLPSKRIVSAELAKSLGIVLAQAHNSGFYHRDLKSCHLLLPEKTNFKLQAQELLSSLVWLDVDDASVFSQLSLRKRVRSLAQIWRYLLRPIGMTDLSVLIGSYLAHSKRLGVSASVLEQLVLKRCREDLSKAEKNGTVLASDLLNGEELIDVI